MKGQQLFFQLQVLDANLVSANWNPEHARGSHLCVKDDALRDAIDDMVSAVVSSLRLG